MSIVRMKDDENGGPLVEASILLPFLFVFLLGTMDFLYALYQWNWASKAVEVGARLAAVSNPVASGLNSIPTSVLSSTVLLGDQMPDFQVTCDGATSSCSCTRGTCTGMGSYSAAAMNTIVFGRGSSACNDATSYYTAGMCDLFPSITAANVRVVYSQTGLGYAGRAAGPVPTITVSLQNVAAPFFFLGPFLNVVGATMPAIRTTHTMTGEALSSGAL
jgi:Flp pilus assembly protein TadG